MPKSHTKVPANTTPRVLNGDELIALVEAGCISNVASYQINAASIDVTLGSHVAYEDGMGGAPTVVLADRTPRKLIDCDITGANYTLTPQRGILIHTEQEFNLPDNISAQYRIKSSMARSGLAEAGAGWVDAGFHGSDLTIALHNNNNFHSIQLDHGTAIGQVVFFLHEPVSEEFSYKTKGNYNNKEAGVTKVGFEEVEKEVPGLALPPASSSPSVAHAPKVIEQISTATDVTAKDVVLESESKETTQQRVARLQRKAQEAATKSAKDSLPKTKE